MAFTKAIALSEAEFRTLVSDEIENFISEYETSGVKDEDIRDYISDSFDRLLEYEKVDEMIVFFSNNIVEIYSGDDFIHWILVYYKIDDLTKLL